MKFYTLDKETMENVQTKLREMRDARDAKEADRIAVTEEI